MQVLYTQRDLVWYLDAHERYMKATINEHSDIGGGVGGTRTVPCNVRRIAGRVGCWLGAGPEVVGGADCVVALMLIGVAGPLLGTEFLDEVARECRGGESGPPLLSSELRRRPWDTDCLAELEGCGDCRVGWGCGAG